jgi:hypothetical protein
MSQRLVLLPWEEYRDLKEGQRGGAGKSPKSENKGNTFNHKDAPIKETHNTTEHTIKPTQNLPEPTINKDPPEKRSPKVPGPPGLLASAWLTWK